MNYRLAKKVACVLSCLALAFVANLYPVERAGLPKVRVRGRQFVAGGFPIVFHGVQHEMIARTAERGLLERHPGPDPVWDYYNFSIDAWFSDSDAAYLESIGINFIRLGFNWDEYSDPIYVELYERLFNRCREHGIYLMPAMIPPGGWGEGSGLWESEQLKDQFVQAWGDIAALTAHRNEVAMYDLQNEPYPPSQAEYIELCIRAKNAIRQHTDKPVVYAWPFAGVDMPDISVFDDEQAVVTWHYYAPIGFTHQRDPGSVYPGVVDGQYWDADLIYDTLRRRFTNWLTDNICPVVLGEFGAKEECDSGRAQWVADVRIFHEGSTPPISWVYFRYKHMGPPEDSWGFVRTAENEKDDVNRLVNDTRHAFVPEDFADLRIENCVIANPVEQVLSE